MKQDSPRVGWGASLFGWVPGIFRRTSSRGVQETTRVKFNLHTISWLGLCCAMGYSGAVQANGAAYILAFLTGTLGVLSYVYARANLRGLEVRVGSGPIQHHGLGEVLPVDLRAASGHEPFGIEVLLIGAPKATFVSQIASGQSTRLYLRLPPGSAPLQLMMRSAYPLGLLHAQRVIQVELSRHAVPPASGQLPLPTAQMHASEVEGRSGGNSVPSREGDDFAGVREWQLGDSPRHIDWRAVARGRPLMVKTWARGVSESVQLDWETLPLPESEKAGQMVRWIQMCEQQGLSYGMSLPGQEFESGRGDAHARRCMQALAGLHVGAMKMVETSKQKRVAASYELSASVPRGPLALLSAVLFLTALPLQELVSLPILVLLFLCLTYRSLIPNPVRLRWLPLSSIGLGILGVYLTQGSLMSMETGIAVLIVLSGGKMLESRTPHDFQVIAMIGWFLCLCGLLADQSITTSVMMLGSFAVITGCMVRFRRGLPGVAAPIKLTGRLLLQALPLVVLLFLVFPRVSLDFLVRLGSGNTTMTGVPSSLDPGKVLQVARSTATAFRVEFPEGNMPDNNQRYWRCVVLWECHGLSWARGLGVSYAPELEGVVAGGIRQIITLEPHGQFWLPTLDYPVKYSKGQGIDGISTDRLLWSRDTVRKARKVDVTSRPQMEAQELPEFHRIAALQLPATLSGKLKNLAEQWRGASATDVEVVETGLNYLRTQGFEYTLEPGSYLGPRALEEFVFQRRIGFCEHFSAAFATLMRAAGVPTRVVMGYLGGEMSMTGTHLIVRQSDAHSWVEVWLEASGWTRIDPTAALAPGRVTLDLQSYLLGDEEALERQRNSLIWRAVQQARLLWDQLNYQWYKLVVSFDEESQIGWLSWLGVGGVRLVYLFVGSIVLVILIMLVLTVWLRRPAREQDPWRRAWGRFCQRLETLGLPARRVSEGPLDYAGRIGADRPKIMELAQQYVDARYGSSHGSLKSFEKDIRDIR